jgi:hypothetical protein
MPDLYQEKINGAFESISKLGSDYMLHEMQSG